MPLVTDTRSPDERHRDRRFVPVAIAGAARPALAAHGERAFARWRWTRSRRRRAAIPACPWAWRTSATVLWSRFLKFDAADPALARPRPLRAVGRPRLDAALRAAASHRLCRHDAGRAASASASSAAARRPSRARPRRRHRDHHRPAGPGPRQRRRHGARRAPAREPLRRRRWSITTPMSSPATAA